MYTATERLWLTADRKSVVKDGDLKAAFLLVIPGGQLSDAEASQYGLNVAKAEPPAENKAENAPAENKSAGGVTFQPQAKRK